MSFFSFAFQWLGRAANWSGSDGVPARLLEHIEYTALAMLISMVIGLLIGVIIGHTGRGALTVIGVVNVWRALPTLGLLILAFVLSNGANWSWLVPLVALAVPPIVVTTYEAVHAVDPALKDAAAGMGMTQWQVLFRVELPVALPLILVGLRTAAIQVISTVTIAAYISLGGLGRYINDGLAIHDYQEVAGGALLVVVLALLVQFAFVGLARTVVSSGLRKAQRPY